MDSQIVSNKQVPKNKIVDDEHHDNGTFHEAIEMIEKHHTAKGDSFQNNNHHQTAKGSQKDPSNNKSGNGKTGTFNVTEHMMSVKELAQLYDTNIDEHNIDKSLGLTKAEVDKRLQKYGKNVLTPPPETPEILKFAVHFLGPLHLMLEVAGILSIIAYGLDKTVPLNLYLGVFLFGIVIAGSLMAYVQERAASNLMAKFKKLLPSKCLVIRDGRENEVKAEELVIGDLVKLATGARIPGDMKILKCSGLKVETSALNGESEAVEIFVDPQSEEFLEAKNIVYNSCLCLEGGAVGLVIRTGDNTFIGTIATQTTQTRTGQTSLQREVSYFVQFLLVMSIIMGAVVFIIAVARLNGTRILYIFINGFIIIIVANVPQGLPATVTSCLTIVAKKLGAENVFVKRLDCIETLGSATVIASDKTGTLTMNKMTVEHLWFNMRVQSV